jgi:hypothetical protein
METDPEWRDKYRLCRNCSMYRSDHIGTKCLYGPQDFDEVGCTCGTYEYPEGSARIHDPSCELIRAMLQKLADTPP